MKMRFLAITTAVSMALFFSQRVSAESYRGIGPFYTLNDVMAIFPGADFEVVDAAWARNWEYLYKVTGIGIEGTIVLKFDHKPSYLEYLSSNAQSDALKGIYNSLIESYVAKPENQRLEVQWVRWVPDAPFPASRLVGKYGNPSDKGFNDKNFEPYWSWAKKGVFANIDDNQNVTAIEFEFTDDEKNQYFARQMGISLEEYKKTFKGQSPTKSKKKSK